MRYNLLSVRNLSISMHYVKKASEVSGAFTDIGNLLGADRIIVLQQGTIERRQ